MMEGLEVAASAVDEVLQDVELVRLTGPTERLSPSERRRPARSLEAILADLTPAEARAALLAPWERLPMEPAEVFRLFEAYRALGPRRTFAQAAGALGRLNHRGLYSSSVTHDAARWAFVERAKAWDIHLINLQREAQEREILERQAEVIEHQRVAGRTLREKGLEFLERVGLATGAEAIRAVSEGVKLERTAEGLPDWVLEVMGASDADLLRRYEELRDAGAHDQSALDDGVVT